MYFSRKCKITFISHGATIFSEEGRFSDSLSYPPLSELGVEEIEKVTNYIKQRGVKNDVIYASPAVRTLQSAMMISKILKKDYVVVNDLSPRSCPDWNGLTFSQILDKNPKAFDEILKCKDVKTPSGGESSETFIKRTKHVIDELVEKNIGNRIIIVTYPDVIQAAICGALDIPADKLTKIFIRTGSVTQISYFEEWASLVYSDYVPL